MTLLEVIGGFVAGTVFGVGVSVFYLRWKVKRQLGAMQGQMEDMMDMTQGMEGLGNAMQEESEDLGDLSNMEEKEEED